VKKSPASKPTKKAKLPAKKTAAKKVVAKKAIAKKAIAKKPLVKKAPPKKSVATKPRGPLVLGVETGAPVTALATINDALIAAADAHQVLHLNKDAALQKHIFADGLVPNSPEFPFTFAAVNYVAQRAENIKTGEVRVYYAQPTALQNIKFVTRGQTTTTPGSIPFKGGNRITQLFAQRPEYYKQFKLDGHEGVDIVPQDGDRDIYCIESGSVFANFTVEGDPKKNVYGIHVVVLNEENERCWYYCHLSQDAVTLHQQVNRGDKIGVMGGTGNVQGDHLHLGLKPVTADKHLTLNPGNGFLGYVDPLPVLQALNAAAAAAAPDPMRDLLLAQAETSGTIPFNPQAALQKQIFADGFCPDSLEFNLTQDATTYVAQRAENLTTGAVRVYYAPTTNFADVKFIEH
jgi:murein DD-endopeptidase MepM/ murein hydrolase activator NlpD